MVSTAIQHHAVHRSTVDCQCQLKQFWELEATVKYNEIDCLLYAMRFMIIN